MTKIRYIGFLFSIFFVVCAQAETLHFKNYENKVSALQKKFKITDQELGLFLAFEEGIESQVLLDRGSHRKMIPASISKILTASAVLEAFPPGTKLKTTLQTTAKVENGILKGDLYLKGGGDPGFVSENMWFLVNHFKRENVKLIEGDIVVDDTLFDSKRYDESRQSTRVDRAYDSPVGAMSFNWNSINIFIRPGSEVGESAKVFVDPENEYIRLVNKAKTSAGGGNKLIIERQRDSKHPGDTIVVSGSLGINAKEQVVFKNITSPDLWSGFNLKSFLEQRGILVKGQVKTGKTPSSARVVAEAESKPIELMVTDMNKFSNNFVAEMLTKLLHSQDGQQGTLNGGIQKIRQHLAGLKIPTDEFEFYNPSGLTRDNLLSSRAMGLLLKKQKQNFQLQPEFLSSLPISGIDGTLKRRLKGTSGERWVRAKTGYLTGVVTLAGYVGCPSGIVGEFSFIFNGKTDEGKVRQFFDEVLLEFVNQCPS